MGAPVNLLLHGVGRKMHLPRRLREEVEKTGGSLVLLSTRAETPNKHLGHFFHQVPPLDDLSQRALFEQTLLELCRKHSINWLLSTHHLHFLWWCDFSRRHPELGVLLSGEQTHRICESKSSAYAWLGQNGFPVAPWALKNSSTLEALQTQLGPLPLFAKPDNGSATRGIAWVRDSDDFAKLPAETILQPLLKGDEYTVNLYVDRQHRCRVVIPHRRIEVTDGEVSVGVTVDEPFLITLGHQLAEKLPDAFGPLCFQVFHDPARGPMNPQSVTLTDLNARFGGGYPLTEAAGGNFAEWLIREAQGLELPASAGTWKAGLKMTRTAEKMVFEDTAVRA